MTIMIIMTVIKINNIACRGEQEAGPHGWGQATSLLNSESHGDVVGMAAEMGLNRGCASLLFLWFTVIELGD